MASPSRKMWEIFPSFLEMSLTGIIPESPQKIREKIARPAIDGFEF
jgi:hypothetical protein